MNNMIRFWNQNRKGIIAGIVAIVLLILFIQILNEIAKQQKEERNNNKIVLTEEEKKLPTESIIGDKKVSIEETKTNVKIIENFVDKCNNGQVYDAYELLTDGCKKALFSSEESFKRGYIDTIFKNKKIINIENYISRDNRYTYKVNFYNDVLSSGNIDDMGGYQDYITIDTNGKLNINNLIYRKEINKELEIEGIKVTIVAQEIYRESENYEIKIKNNTKNRILIDTNKKSKSVYVVGSNNITYNSYIDEVSDILLEIPRGIERTYNIGFNKIYSIGVITNSIVFTDIVLDCEKYKQTPEEVKERLKITISV